MAAQWPLVKARLVELLLTLPGWAGSVRVFNGPPVTNDNPKNYATVGYVADDNPGSYTLTADPDGLQWQEAGDVRCHLVCRSGGTDIAAVEATSFGLLNAVEASIRADWTLGGVLSRNSTVQMAVEPQADQQQSGAAFGLIFTVSYTTVT